jgi:2-hydroxy-6-oxonona-2,4-dienedioate hydrolase
MVLMGCGGNRNPMFGPQPTEGIKALQLVYRDRSFQNFRAFFDIMLYDGSTVPDEVLQKRAESVRQDQVDAWIESYKSPHRSLAMDVGKIQAPTLIMHGRDDRIVAFEGGLSLLSDLPNSELHAFNRCGHWIQYEHAEVFNELVLNFFARP